MTDRITIPPEALEAAARAICETENGPCKCMPDECGCIYWKAHATTALRAGLAAWPGVDYRPGAKVTKTWRDPGKIILPLTQESGR